MNANTVSMATALQLEFKLSQSEGTRKDDPTGPFYQTARLTVSLYNRVDEALESLTTIEVLSLDPLPNIADVGNQLMSSLKYRCPHCIFDSEAVSVTAQHALRLLSQEHQLLSRDPIPESNRLNSQASIIERLLPRQ